jgi:hypothetical protein
LGCLPSQAFEAPERHVRLAQRRVDRSVTQHACDLVSLPPAKRVGDREVDLELALRSLRAQDVCRLRILEVSLVNGKALIRVSVSGERVDTAGDRYDASQGRDYDRLIHSTSPRISLVRCNYSARSSSPREAKSERRGLVINLGCCHYRGRANIR